jgi:Zn-dependent metalloprotease
MSLVGVVLLLVVLGGPIHAQPVNFGLLQLEADAEGPLEVTLAAETGYPSFIRGRIPVSIKGDETNPVASATVFLNSYGSAFGIENAAADLSLVSAEADGLNMTRVTWQQVVDGVPVYNALFKVHLEADAGAVLAATSGYVPDLYTPTTVPQLTSDQALANAVLAMPAGTLNARPILVIYPYIHSARRSIGVDHRYEGRFYPRSQPLRHRCPDRSHY